MKLKNHHGILTLICLLLSVLVFITFVIRSKYFEVVHDWPMGRNGVRYILFWNKMWTYDDYGLGFGSEIFKSCPIKNCFTTKNKDLIPIEEFDALIFHGPEYSESFLTKPSRRNPKQVYIYYNLENSFNTPLYLYSYGFFNWTVTYR